MLCAVYQSFLVHVAYSNEEKILLRVVYDLFRARVRLLFHALNCI